MNYYNENDIKAAAWLRELIREGLIPPGDVDTRSIVDVTSDDLRGFIQCHFFAGIGGWPLALRIAGVPDDEPLDTGSCPCPPFSSAGKKKACPECGGKTIPHPLKTGVFACVPCGHQWLADYRHLWPEFLRLIAYRKTPTVFGEQVVGTDGLVWLAGIRVTLERLGYGVGAADLCAAGIGAPHLRQRIFFGGTLADNKSERLSVRHSELHGHQGEVESHGSTIGWVGNTDSAGSFEGNSTPSIDGHRGAPFSDGRFSGLGHPIKPGLEGFSRDGHDGHQPRRELENATGSASAASSLGAWSNYDLIQCADGKARRIESGTFPLAYGIPARVGRLRGYGNAIVPQVAAEFIRAFFEAKGGE